MFMQNNNLPWEKPIPQLKSFITIEGAGADKTIVQWGDTAQTAGPKGQLSGTYEHHAGAAATPGKQAGQFRISADTAAFVGCKFLGAQDTLYDHLGRHYYKDCYIEGSVDFIFGNGLSLFEHSGALYLGRAWGPFSRVVFAYTYMDNIIIPKGWYNWGDPSREMTVFYGQYKCTGPGASFAGRVSWSRELTDEEAKPFISLTFIDGSEWIKI
ncbi:UNVERIFIED_CONTAM: putative pectinesterase 53 [Sesamum angustifolium]|uniref:Pectinesterase n=1 Tax=Sesamum angustifolium TaxID=2727405 RepID=A0AAW2MSY9_9LAMI